jgi:hypothetical protein
MKVRANIIGQREVLIAILHNVKLASYDKTEWVNRSLKVRCTLGDHIIILAASQPASLSYSAASRRGLLQAGFGSNQVSPGSATQSRDASPIKARDSSLSVPLITIDS